MPKSTIDTDPVIMNTVRLMAVLDIANLKRAIERCRIDIPAQYSSDRGLADALGRVDKLEAIILVRKIPENSNELVLDSLLMREHRN